MGKRKSKQDNLADRNYRIVEHLRSRFMSRHGVELTKKRRLMLLEQIRTGIAKRLSLADKGRIFYRVYIYSNEDMANRFYSVVFDPSLKQIITVLPRKDSSEYMSFVQRYGLDYDVIIQQEMTAKERTDASVKAAYNAKQERVRAEVEKERQRRIRAYREFKATYDYFNGRLDNRVTMC